MGVDITLTTGEVIKNVFSSNDGMIILQGRSLRRVRMFINKPLYITKDKKFFSYEETCQELFPKSKKEVNGILSHEIAKDKNVIFYYKLKFYNI
jgi:hypothetical protein